MTLRDLTQTFDVVDHKNETVTVVIHDPTPERLKMVTEEAVPMLRNLPIGAQVRIVRRT